MAYTVNTTNYPVSNHFLSILVIALFSQYLTNFSIAFMQITLMQNTYL
jgi:hypothetical protein